MNKNYLEILCCPQCKSSLYLEGDEEKTDTILEGELSCQGCGKRFTVKKGIVRFIKMEELGKVERRFENFRRFFYSYIYEPFTRFEFIFCGGEKKSRHECLDRLEIRPGSRILETDIGTGSNLPYLTDSLDKGCFFGVDISSSMLRNCR